ncbi:hydrogenase maturation protease [Oceanirhabdus sp. W0125-5]|uniref:hydrogenase maturation protease n=1 Tax=Oceanirhabdus sp. W0125-5 TaxID=2999116 RepID=UPI0022F2F56A|nr:hydrogenase maturation protease [Oceanirhabdus sp. W0125-5]WBW99667.1 hydrogenase maturation protease [Oceanirhabdus sp. W0125-5]
MKKILALGNILLSNGGVTIYLADYLDKEFNALGYEVIKCENDIRCALSCIEEDDEIIIMDASFTGDDSGRIHTMNLEDYETEYFKNKAYSQSNIIFDYIFKKNKKIRGKVILIEVCNMELNDRLSKMVVESFEKVALTVLEEVKKIENRD